MLSRNDINIRFAYFLFFQVKPGPKLGSTNKKRGRKSFPVQLKQALARNDKMKAEVVLGAMLNMSAVTFNKMQKNVELNRLKTTTAKSKPKPEQKPEQMVFVKRTPKRILYSKFVKRYNFTKFELVRNRLLNDTSALWLSDEGDRCVFITDPSNVYFIVQLLHCLQQEKFKISKRRSCGSNRKPYETKIRQVHDKIDVNASMNPELVKAPFLDKCVSTESGTVELHFEGKQNTKRIVAMLKRMESFKNIDTVYHIQHTTSDTKTTDDALPVDESWSSLDEFAGWEVPSTPGANEVGSSVSVQNAPIPQTNLEIMNMISDFMKQVAYENRRAKQIGKLALHFLTDI